MRITWTGAGALGESRQVEAITSRHCSTGNGLGEYADLDMPDIMERRRALHEKSIVQEILARIPEKTDSETERTLH